MPSPIFFLKAQIISFFNFWSEATASCPIPSFSERTDNIFFNFWSQDKAYCPVQSSSEKTDNLSSFFLTSGVRPQHHA